jgi:UPF0176 protein
MTDLTAPIRVTTLYQFTRLADPEALREPLDRLCRVDAVRGTLLLAREGINGTIAGAPEAVERVLAHIRSLPGCDDLRVRDATCGAMPFYRLKVRVKDEIVSMGAPDIDAVTGAGTHVAPGDWNELIARPGTILIDTRNDSEVAIGTFPGAIDPGTRHFRDFPAWFREHRGELLAHGARPRIAMFCTGGIRCEKATAFLRAEGLDEVYHLDGGILNYLESVPAGESRWAGECFVFDERVTVAHGLTPGTHELCRGCRMPVGVDDRASSSYEPGVSCPGCHAARDDRQRRGYAERHRQVRLARDRGHQHVGASDG